jgi:hypothetical protein
MSCIHGAGPCRSCAGRCRSVLVCASRCQSVPVWAGLGRSVPVPVTVPVPVLVTVTVLVPAPGVGNGAGRCRSVPRSLKDRKKRCMGRFGQKSQNKFFSEYGKITHQSKDLVELSKNMCFLEYL